MRIRSFTVSLSIVLSLVLSPVTALLLPTRQAQAQQTPFLITPYYGNATITSRFDHHYPTYGDPPNNYDNIFQLFDGTWYQNPPPVDRYNCQGVRCYDGHDGYDFTRAENGGYFRVLAAAGGTVTEVRWNNLGNRGAGWGLYIEITHSNGYVTRYAHLSAAAVSPGQYVLAGQIIGTSGNTGVSTGTHLHFGVLNNNGRKVDPFNWTGAGDDPWAVHAQGATSWFMWADGEFAGSPLADPTPAGSPTVYVDDTTNNTGGFSKGSGGPFNNVCQGDCGGWTSEAAGIGNHIYHTPADRARTAGGDQWARWRPTIPSPGVYEVWVWVPYSWNATSWQAPYVIETGAGPFTAYGVDQAGLVNRWVCIGAYHFLSGSQAYVYVTDATDETNYTRRIGVDQIKFIQRPTHPTYVPDLKFSGGGMSRMIMRNNSNSPADVYVSYLDSSGEFTCGTPSWGPLEIPANGNMTYAAYSIDAVSGVVDASQDVSVVVETMSGSGNTLKVEGYTGFSQGDTASYLPTVGNRLWEWSKIPIMNTGSGTANVTTQFFDRNGSQKATQYHTLAPNGRATIDLQYVYGLPTDFLGSAYVSSNSPIVAEATTYFNLSPVNDSASYEGLASGSTGSLYFPQVKRRQFGGSWYDYSGIVVQNLNANNSAGVTVSFYDRDGNPVTSFDDTIPANSSHGYNTRYYNNQPLYIRQAIETLGYGFNGSVRVQSNDGREIVGVCKTWIEGNVNAIEMYVGEDGGTSGLIVPLVYRKTDDGQWADPQDSASWVAYTGVIVQNLGGTTANVTVHVYNGSGTEVASFNDTISPWSPHGYNTRYGGDAPAGAFSGLGYNFTGSMRVESSNGRPLTAVVDVGLESKAVYYYNAVQR